VRETPAPSDCLQATTCINSDHPAVIALARSLTEPASSDLENACALYYWSRDQVRYNPYGIGPTAHSLSASVTLESREAWCVPKAVLLAALCRAVGIPACVGFADVRNHLSTERLREHMDTDVFYFHGYTSIYLNDKWVKATPAFNVELCEKFGLHALEFDGLADSLYHEFDTSGNKHMEYLNDRGEYIDVPFEEMMAIFDEHYPGMVPAQDASADALDAANWERDVEQELEREIEQK
jgi:transglutaminase-like putative cysteine protease